jgi:hypothetical protein
LRIAQPETHRCGPQRLDNEVRSDCAMNTRNPGTKEKADPEVREVKMKDRKPWLVMMLALTGGMLGGAIATMLGAGNAFALHHVGHAKTVEAERFVLLGRTGDERGIIRVNDKGTAAFYMNDEKGREKAELRVTADGRTSLGFYDDTGLKRLVVGEGAAPQSEAGIAVFAPNGNQVIDLSSSGNGEVNLTLYDAKSGLARAGLGLSADGVPALALFDQNGKDRAELHLDASGKPGLALADENGKSIAGMPMQAGSGQ